MIDKDPPQAGDGATTEATVNAFNQAFNRHDVDGVMSLMTDDCLFENTLPRPDGERHIGQAAVRRFWDKFFGDSPDRKSTRLNSSHTVISYAVFCLKKKKLVK